MCLYPKIIENPKYKPNRANNGVPPVLWTEKVKYIEIKCGVCSECRKSKANQWKIRIIEELKVNPKAIFVTMTFSNEALEQLNYNDKKPNQAVGRAIELFRKRWYKKYKKPIKHWLVTEKGDEYTKRIHLHGLIWTDLTEEQFEKDWGYGWVYFGYETSLRTINYIVKYITKEDPANPDFKGKVFASKGIGASYIAEGRKTNKFNEDKTEERYRLPNGIKVGLPVYYRNKIYSGTEREMLRIQKIDSGERWINGIKMPIVTENQRNEAMNAYKEAQRQEKLRQINLENTK